MLDNMLQLCYLMYEAYLLQSGGEILNKIREARKKAGLSQVQLSELANVHRTIIARCEEGVNMPSFKTLCKIASALKVPVDELIDKKAG